MALTEPVDSTHAPWPTNSSERLLFAQLYEPLLRVDCTGRIVAAVARSWEMDSMRAPRLAEWSFVLRDDLHFRNGQRVVAADVIASWRSSAAAHSEEPSGTLIAALASGARALDDSTLVVTLPYSLSSPRIFASPQLAVAHWSPASGWPVGTTSYDVASTAAAGHRPAPARTITLRSSTIAPPLIFEAGAGRDARDILDGGVDLLRTGSAAAVQYAATQPGRSLLRLPWSRTYLLAQPSRDAIVRTDRNCVAADELKFRAALATAVHDDARGAERPFWWVRYDLAPDSGFAPNAPPCAALQGSPAGTGSPDVTAPRRYGAAPLRIVYRRDDATARELAERIVALAAPGTDSATRTTLESVAPWLLAAGGWRAVGLDSLPFARALASREEPAYILSLPRHPISQTFAAATLLAAAPWVGSLDQPAAFILPLVDTRETLIARRSRALPRITVEWDGTLIFDPRDPAAPGSTP